MKKDKKRQKLAVEVVEVGGGELAPYVTHFPSGTRPAAHAASKSLSGSDEAGDAKLEFRAYKNSEKFKSSQHVLVAVPAGANEEPSGVDYVARNFGPDSGASASAPCHYALGIVDRNSGTVRMIPIAGDRVMRMNARVRGLEYKDDNRDAAEDVTRKADTQEERIQRRSELLRVSAKDLEAEAAVTRNLPPYNLHAERAEDVYPLGQLIVPEEWAELKTHNLMKAAVNEKHRQMLWDEGTYPAYVFNRLARLRVADDSDGNKQRAHCLEYLTYLLKLHQAPPTWLKARTLFALLAFFPLRAL
eukprot:jgi/Mesvir1/1280/Mv07885-RA.1